MASPARWRRRPLPVAAAVAAIPITIAVAVLLRPVDLTEVLLVALVEVVAVSLVAGRLVAGLTALGTVAAVNWFLVPPYATFTISSPDNVVSLLVFLLLAVGASSGVDAVVTAEAATAAATERQRALNDVLRPQMRSPAEALETFRQAFELSGAQLCDAATRQPLLRAGEVADAESFQIEVDPGYLIIGHGEPRLGRDEQFTRSMATAVVGAWEGQRLRAEQERAAQLAEIDRARAALLASVGHDLRTPLAGIRLCADALDVAEGDLPPQERAALIADLRESAIRLDQVLGAVLDSSRVEAGVQPVQRAPVDLREVVRSAVALWASDRIVLDLPDQPVPAVTDAALLERIVANLVSNALSHGPPDGRVAVACSADRIAVLDEGPGVTSGGVDQGRSSSGMGLLIVDRLAGAIGATVTYDSPPGGGLRATVQVPG